MFYFVAFLFFIKMKSIFYSFAVGFYEPLIDEINRVGQLIPVSRRFVSKIDSGIRELEYASISQKKTETLSLLAKIVKDAESMASVIRFDPTLYELFKTVPVILDKLSVGIQRGAKDPTDLNSVMGYFYRAVAASIPK